MAQRQTLSLQSCLSVRLLARRIKGWSAAGEVRVTDAHPGGGIHLRDAETNDEEGSGMENRNGATQVKFQRSFLIKGS